MTSITAARIADIEAASPAFRPYPSRLIVEVTSRCNLSCAMCMKQNGGSTGDGDLAPQTFAALEPALPQLEVLVLNGVGEPLLSSRLEEYVARARRLMPPWGWIGFQSNGLLLTELRATALAEAGVDRVCLSLDGASPDTFRTLREGGELSDLERALAALRTAAKVSGRRLGIGVEFVLMRENLRELPAAIAWAAERGATFALVSHLVPYDAGHLASCAYDLNTLEALALFHAWKSKADIAGIDLSSYHRLLWKMRREPHEQRVVDFVEALKENAAGRGVTLDLRRLLADDERICEVAEVFAAASAVAAERGIELHLPEPAPRQSRRCDFVEKGSAFVSRDGGVHPCYYLWHGCRSWAAGWLHPVQPKLFGTLSERGIGEIWNNREFRSYRANVLAAEYPFCPGCTFAPCDFVQGESFSHDCYVNAEPCGSCLWSSGLFRCLS